MPDNDWLKPTPKQDTSWMKPATTKNSGSVVTVGGVQQNLQDSPDKYDFTPKFGQNNEKLRAQDQSWLAQAGLTLGNGASNVITGLVEGFGYIPELFDDANDYSNALTRTIQKAHNPLGEIYREDPNKTWDLTDPAWWFENTQQLVESAGAFALEGAGLAKLFGTAAKGAGELLQLGKKGLQTSRALAQTLTAGTLAYTEGAMSGYRVYDEVYKKQYDKALKEGNSPDAADGHAKQMAGQAAATTVRMNTIMNTVLNLGEVAPFFKEPSDEVLTWFKTQGRRAEGESLSAWKNRVQTASLENPELRKAVMVRHGLTSRLAEAAKEGIEEVNTQYAEEEGKRVGDGKNRTMLSALSDYEQYFNDVTNQEGGLNFVLGAFGGVAQIAILDHLPSRYTTYDRDNNQLVKKAADGKVEYDSDGKPKYQQFLVSPKSYTERGTKEYFTSIQKAIIKDIEKQEDLRTALIVASAAKNTSEAERLRGEIFSIGALDAVAKGMTENWQEEYKQIAALDNTKDLGEQMQTQVDESAKQLMQAQEQGGDTQELEKAHAQLIQQQQSLMGVTEAMQKGYATSKEDRNYKEKAEQAVQDLKHLQNLHAQIQKQYVDHDSPISGEVADHLFFRNADLYMRKQAIDREQMRIERAEGLQTHALPTAENFDNLITKYNEHLNTWSSVIDQMNDDVKVLQGNDKEAIKALFSKYRAKGTNEDDFTGAVGDLVKKIHVKQKLYKTSVDTAKDEMQSSIGYTKWKENNPNGKFEDYTQAVAGNAILLHDKANLQYVKDLHEIANQNLNELTSGKGLNGLYRDLAEDKRKMVDAMNARNRQNNLDKFFAQQSKSAADRLSAVEKERLVTQLEEQLTKWKTEFNELEQQRVTLETQLKDYLKGKGILTNLNKTIPLRQEIKQVKNRVSSLEAQINSAEHQLNLLIPQAQAAAEKYEATVTEQESEEEIEEMNESEEIFEPLNASQETFLTADELLNFEEPVATDEYIKLKDTLPASAVRILDKIEAEHTEGSPYSYEKLKNAMRPLLAAKEISQSTVNKVQIELREYLREKDKPVKPAQQKEVEDIPQSAAEVTEELTPAVEENVQPLTLDNSALFTEENIESVQWEQSAKTTNAVKGNSSDLVYKTIEIGGVRKLRNVTKDGAPVLDPTTNRETLIPGAIQPGHQVYLQIDTDWNGKILNDEELAQDEYLNEIKVDDKFEMYLDNGKIRMDEFAYGNVPIKIVDAATGETLKYFPRADWITATQGAADYRNVEDEFPADENGERLPGNVELQKTINLRIRKRLVEMWNANPEAKLPTTVTSVSGGRVMYHGDLNENTGKMKYRPQLAEKLLPDTSLQFGIANKDGLLVGKNKKAQEKMEVIDLNPQQMERLIGTAENSRSSVVTFIPVNNGKFLPIPMLTTPLTKRQGEINTVSRVIELYLQNGTDALDAKGEKLIAQIQDKTGFDITTSTGLKDFIEQYFTLTNNFSDTKTAADGKAIAGKKLVRWLFSVPDAVGNRKDGKADIKVGTTYSGKKPIRAELVNGTLSARFRDALIAGLGTRMKNVNFTNGNLKGVNDPRPITQITINSNDVLSAKEYPNYNAYLKSFVQTSVYGKTQVKDSKGKSHYVYAVNGQMMLDASKLLPSAADSTNARELVSNLSDVNKVEENFDDVADEIDAWGMDNSSRNIDMVKHTIQPAGKELTLANLQELYNFTPTDNRNTINPEEALQHLQSLGISKIADGYNPFIKC